MNFSHHKAPTIAENKRLRAQITFTGTNDSCTMQFINNKAENRKELKRKIRIARRVVALTKKDIRKYREQRRISSVQFADKLMSFADRNEMNRFLAMVSPTIADLDAGYYAS